MLDYADKVKAGQRPVLPPDSPGTVKKDYRDYALGGPALYKALAQEEYDTMMVPIIWTRWDWYGPLQTQIKTRMCRETQEQLVKNLQIPDLRLLSEGELVRRKRIWIFAQTKIKADQAIEESRERVSAGEMAMAEVEALRQVHEDEMAQASSTLTQKMNMAMAQRKAKKDQQDAALPYQLTQPPTSSDPTTPTSPSASTDSTSTPLSLSLIHISEPTRPY